MHLFILPEKTYAVPFYILEISVCKTQIVENLKNVNVYAAKVVIGALKLEFKGNIFLLLLKFYIFFFCFIVIKK